VTEIEELREQIAELEKRVVALERVKRRPELRVVRSEEEEERVALSSIGAILSGGSERQRVRTGLTHRDVCERLRGWTPVGYSLMLAFGAAQPTPAKQINFAAAAIGEITLLLEEKKIVR
jgi:hypothetical protein